MSFPARLRALALLGALVVFLPARAVAQRPICPSPSSEEPVRTLCRPAMVFPTSRFLADFTVDHLFKPSPPPFTRSLADILRPVVGREISADTKLESLVDTLPTLQFIQLDRTTGTVRSAPPKRQAEPQKHSEFEAVLAEVDGSPSLKLKFPQRLEGGYWRSPDALQIAFWQHHRMAAQVVVGDGKDYGGEIECVALSPGSILVRFVSPDQPPLLVLPRSCAP